ncbi:MAG: hypothetical protein ABI564_06410 [Ideonella sp.]
MAGNLPAVDFLWPEVGSRIATRQDVANSRTLVSAAHLAENGMNVGHPAGCSAFTAATKAYQ